MNKTVKQLEAEGYIVTLHHIDEVKELFICDDGDAREVLATAIDMYLDSISDAIYDVAEQLELKEVTQ